MELFPDGTHVRLQSRRTGAYLHGDEDGADVSLRPRGARASLNAAWRVQRVARYGGAYVLLQSAACGRYLALSAEHAPPGRHAVLSDYDEPGMTGILWSAIGAGDGTGDVLVRHFCRRLLRAGVTCRLWRTGVAVDEDRNRSSMMHWMVQAIPPRPAPPVLPGPSLNLGCLFRRRRTIWYVWADDHGKFDEFGGAAFEFYGRSLFELRAEVARHAGEEITPGITLCVRPGTYGLLSPLVIDLPRSEEPMDIVVLVTWAPAHEELRYPDVDAP